MIHIVILYTLTVVPVSLVHTVTNVVQIDQQYQVHFVSQYGARIVTYFSVFKLWFTLRASASAVAPESPILFHSRLWERVLQNQ